MSTTQCAQGKLGSLSGLLLTIGIGFALYILIPLLPHIGVQDYGFSPEEGYQLLTQVGGLYVGNMVDTVYSLVASVDKKYLQRQS